MRLLVLGLLATCALAAGLAEDFEYEKPTVLLTLLVRNKAHILPLFLSYVQKLDYPKKRIAIWLRCDHSSDDSSQLLQQWLRKSGDLYHSINYGFDDDDATSSYENETSIYDWPVSRFKHVIALKEQALQYARDIWADYIFFLDADVLLTSPQALTALTRLQLPIVAPMLHSEGLYSNFWCGMTEDYYYQRTDEYKEIYHSRKVGVYEVPVVHTAVLIDMNYAGARYLTFDREKLQQMQQESEQQPVYNGPVDDIIVFAISANSSGVPLRVSNEIAFGYLMQPLETTDSLEHDLQQVINLRANMVHDLGAVPPLLKYFERLVELPAKSKLNFDEIFMINLLRRPERREKMERLFDEIGLDVQHFAAVDGKELDAQRVQQMGISFLPGYEDPYHHRPMTMGEIGCFLSHYRIWQQIVQRQLKQVLILEDDIRFEPYFRSNVLRVLEQAEQTPYDLIYLGRKRLKDENEPWVEGTDNLVHVGYSYWTLAYVITLQGAEKLLAAKPLEKLIPVDEFLPIMFDRHPQKDWSAAFEPRDLIAFSAAPLLLYPTHYTGESGYISDTEDSKQVETTAADADEPQPKSDRQQIFANEPMLGESSHVNAALPQLNAGKIHQEL
ncbi:glycosyltransferase 25 family member [Drosophila sulfurigaster albostrigata]|uniref:glycosyltransferase 25 family member n=1 Tax=Drosophila sulfurigaster albostrigata TaxID=89887 RepID=UPI002D218AB3|nr:glycosyltransferase 25 family member [Drosophila sulfurigaster albostrigata]